MDRRHRPNCSRGNRRVVQRQKRDLQPKSIHILEKKRNGWPLLNDLRLGFNWRLTEGGGSGPSTTTPPDAPEDCVLGFNVRLTEGGEKGVMGRSAGLGLAKGNGLARFE